MPEISTFLVIVLFLMGMLAGTMGALLGLGGGVFLVPFLVLVIKLPMTDAVGISLMTVIATSSVVTAQRAGRHLINLRLGMLLEVATAAGGLTGGIVVWLMSPQFLQRLFGVVTAVAAVVMLRRLHRRNVILDPGADPGRLGGRYHEDESGGTVVYRVRRLPLALGVSFIAGSVSSLLGLGGGIMKVPALNAWCGVPLRAAAATSAFMIGVTATAGAIIYYGRGEVVPWMAASTVLGVLAGSRAGFVIGFRARAKWLKLALAIILLVVCGLMFLRAR
jgi:uncharacterized membrane protein YfcA